MEIRPDDLSRRQVQALLAAHLDGMRQNSPPNSVHALDLSGLKSPAVSVWAVWEEDDLCGIGALKQLSPESGEIKSMRTAERHLRKGVGRALLEHIIAEARRRGYRMLSLETGSGAEFEAAVNLYRTYGFNFGEPFGDYESTDFNQFMHLEL